LIAEYSTELAPTPQVSYLTTDTVGSARIITNENGAVTSRKDFGPFGDETVTAERSPDLGYNPPNIRQDYAGYLELAIQIQRSAWLFFGIYNR
jgi:hypothetical protein